MHRPQQPPPGVDHQTHDRLLLVRLACDDISHDERRAAEALSAACRDCAALVRDIQLISRATARLPGPRRTRDFRLSPEQARRARGSLLTGIMERLSAPGLGILQPLGAAAVAIGFVLVVVGMGLPSMGGASQGGEAAEVYSDFQPSPASAVDPDSAPAESAPAAAPAEGAPAAEATDSSMGPAEGAAASLEVGDPVEGTAARPLGSEPPRAAGAPSAVAGGALDTAASPPGAEVSAGDVGERLTSSERDSGTPAGAGIVTLGLLLGVTGLLVIILRVLAQRVSRDPTMR